MKQTLGKILLFLSLTLYLYADGVSVTVNPPAVYAGENVSFTISADGDKILFPDISEIDGSTIEGTSSSQSTSIINGDVSRQVAKTYTFTPQKSITIPSYKVVIDGKTYHTKAQKVSVLKPQASKKGSEFLIETAVDKKEARVGEAINLTVTFKQRLDAKANKLELGEPKLEDFWIKKVDNIEKKTEGQYIAQKLHYILFPQKSGDYTLPAIQASIGKVVQTRGRAGGMFNDPFFNDPFFSSMTRQLKWKKIFSNQIKLHIKPLPDNLELYGDFKISANVDKQTVKANKPVNLTITINAQGNVDDIKKFNLDIDNAIVYADEPQIKSIMNQESYGGTFTQKIAIVSDKDYTIPPLTLHFFDKKTNKPKTIQTDPIAIKVTGGTQMAASQPPKVEELNHHDKPTAKVVQTSPQKVIVEKEESSLKYLFLLMGILLGAVGAYTLQTFQAKRSKTEPDIIKNIKKAKTDKALFETLLPYAKEGELISQTLQQLEENLYKKTMHKIDKNALYDFFEENAEHYYRTNK